MPINVGDLMRERERLLGVLDEAKIARSRIRQINVLVTMYGDDKKVSLVKPGSCMGSGCSESPYVRGLCSIHYSQWQKRGKGWQALDKVILKPRNGGRAKLKSVS